MIKDNIIKAILSVTLMTLILLLSIIPHVSMVSSEEGHKLLWKRDLGNWVFGVCWSRDGERLVAVGAFKGVTVFDRKGNVVWEDKLENHTCALSIDPSGEYLIVGVGKHGLYFYNLKSGKIIYETKIKHWVWSTCWSPRSTYIMVGSVEGSLYLYRWTKEEVKLEWRKNIARDWIYSICFHPERIDRIALGCRDCHVYFIDLDGNVLWRRKLDDWVYDVCFSPNGSYIAAVTLKGSVYILRASNGEILFKDRPSFKPLESIVWHGNYIMTGGEEGIIYIYMWFEISGKLELLYSFKAAENWIPEGYGLSFNPKYNLLAVASRDKHIYVYDLSGVVKVTLTPTITTSTVTTTRTIIITAVKTRTIRETVITTKVLTLTRTIVSTITMTQQGEVRTKTLTKLLPIERTVTNFITKRMTVTMLSIVTSIIRSPSMVSLETLTLLIVAATSIIILVILILRRRNIQ